MSWRRYSNWAKERPITLRVADFLGRGRGRMRLLDHVNPPARPRLHPNLQDWENHELAAVWIGHATVLLRFAGLTIITDPVLFNRVGVGFGLFTGGPRRYVAPALSTRQLPRLDLILLSHAHFDHLDRPTLSRLNKNVPVIAAHQTLDLVRDLGFRRIAELQWGESLRFRGIDVTAQRVKHWGARTFYDSHRGFNAYLLSDGTRRILYGGDTAYHEGFRDVGKVNLAIFGIGGYDPYIAAHANPEEVWQMADHCRAEHILPIHHSTFRLSHEPMHEPMERLMCAAGRGAERIVVGEIGGSWSLN